MIMMMITVANTGDASLSSGCSYDKGYGNALLIMMHWDIMRVGNNIDLMHISCSNNA
jgi:hypothetical protein